MHRGVVVVSLFACLTVSSTVLAVDLPFAAATTIDGEYAWATAVDTGDIDGDGVLDVAAVAYFDDTLYWWQGGGDGTFTARTVATGVASMSDVEIVDVDGDGDADLLVCAGGTVDAVAWYANDGTPVDGGWTLLPIAISFNDAAAVAAGDFDVDGDLDAVGVAPTAGEIAVALNNGPGIPTYETVDAAFANVRWVDVGDMDGDGDPDVAAASYDTSGSIAWWSRAGAGTWTKHAVAALANIASLELADVDLDGDLDVVASTQATAPIRWYENNGSGGGWAPNNVGTAVDVAYGLLAYDIDRDGDLDIIFGEDGDDAVRWWENADSQGSLWTLRTVAEGTVDTAFDFAVGDADGDGDPELFGVAVADDDLVMWENLSIHRTAVFPEDLSAGDIDWSSDMEVVDVDGDGDLDLFAADEELEQLVWSENDDGWGTSWTVHVIQDEADFKALAAGDFNGDGTLDVAACIPNAVSWWEHDGAGTWTAHVVPSTVSNCRALEAADFDRDGDLDLITGANGSGFDWYENTDGAGGTWSEIAIDGGSTWDADCMAVADMDGDGDPDIAVSTETDVNWLDNRINTYGYISGRLEIYGDLLIYARSVAVGDIDGDGDPDVASLLQSDDVVVWFENTAGDASTWGTEQTIVSGIDGPRTVALADLDLDGDIDCVVIAESSASDCILAWYENTAGDGSAWTSHVISTETFRASPLTIVDMEPDGDPDLIHDSVHGEARWWPNWGGQFAMPTTATVLTTMDEEELYDIFKIVVSHRGIATDSNLEPSLLSLGISGLDGLMLSQAEADALFSGFYVFEDDDDSGDFDPNFDTQVASQIPPVVSPGGVSLVLPDGDARLEVTPSLDRTLFVVVAIASGAASATPNQFQMWHMYATSVAEDRDHDTALLIENNYDGAVTGVVTVVEDLEIFSDDFETGNTFEWSSTVGG